VPGGQPARRRDSCSMRPHWAKTKERPESELRFCGTQQF